MVQGFLGDWNFAPIRSSPPLEIQSTPLGPLPTLFQALYFAPVVHKHLSNPPLYFENSEQKNLVKFGFFIILKVLKL